MRNLFQKITIADLILAIALYAGHLDIWAFLIGLSGLSMAGIYVLLEWTGELDEIDRAEAENDKK